jgi:alpha-glucosidase
VPLAFLGDGKFKAKIWQDGDSPTELEVTERVVGAGDSIELALAPSGGAAVRITR